MSERLDERMQAYARWRQMEDLKSNISASRRFAEMLQQDAKSYIEQTATKAPIEILALLSIYEEFDTELNTQKHLLLPITTAHNNNSETQDQICIEFLQQVYRGLDLFQTRMFYQLQVNGVFKRRTRTALPRKSVDLLTTWAEQHNYSLPTHEEKLYLSSTVGLAVDQISNWFTNAKARKWNKKRPAAEATQQTPKRLAIITDDNSDSMFAVTTPKRVVAADNEDQSTFPFLLSPNTEQLLNNNDNDLDAILSYTL